MSRLFFRVALLFGLKDICALEIGQKTFLAFVVTAKFSPSIEKTSTGGAETGPSLRYGSTSCQEREADLDWTLVRTTTNSQLQCIRKLNQQACT